MLRRLLSLALSIWLATVVASPVDALTTAQRVVLFGGAPGWVLKGATVDLNFAGGQYYGSSLAGALSITRASGGTDLLPSSASGASFQTFGNNTLRITSGKGLLSEEARTNVLLNSTAPATQTTASLATGQYIVWQNGPGSTTPSAGTATLTGITAASQGSPGGFTVSVAGTVTLTVSGSPFAFQCELGAFGTSLIVTTGTTATRAADTINGVGQVLTLAAAAKGSLVFQTGATPNLAGFPFILSNGSQSVTFVRTLSSSTFRTGAGGVNATVTLGSGSFASGSVKSGFAWDGTGRSAVGNNGTVFSDANSYSGALDLFIGTSLDGYVQRLTLWNSRLPDATIKALTI